MASRTVNGQASQGRMAPRHTDRLIGGRTWKRLGRGSRSPKQAHRLRKTLGLSEPALNRPAVVLAGPLLVCAEQQVSNIMEPQQMACVLLARISAGAQAHGTSLRSKCRSQDCYVEIVPQGRVESQYL